MTIRIARLASLSAAASVLVASTAVHAQQRDVLMRVNDEIAQSPAKPGALTAAHVNAADDRQVAQGFSVVLVLGDIQPSSAADNVPTAARKALTDLKDFLPYKGYRLLDTQWTSCCGATPLISRLRGPDDQDYDLELTPSAVGNGKISVRFALREPAAPAATSGEYSAALHDKEVMMLTAQRNDLERRLVDLRQKLDERHPDIAQIKALIAERERQMDALRLEDSARRVSAAAGNTREVRRAVIDTSFMMAVGETVVVGTSRLKGDKALIALLTAIPQRAPAR
jgi:hypothetical protein